MHNLLVSVHVPKCGGSTLKTLFNRISQHIYLDYEDRPLSADSARRRISNLARDNVRYLEILSLLTVHPKELIVVHGHFMASKYSLIFPEARFAIWFRDPVERLISHYYHWLRDPDLNHTLCKRLIEEKLTLPEFAAVVDARNVQCRFMDHRLLEAFDFVGITEEYDRSMRLFLKIFSPMVTNHSYLVRNQNPQKRTSTYDVDDETRVLVEEYNKQDREAYQSATRRFDQLCKVYEV